MTDQPQNQPKQPEKRRQRKPKGRSNGEGSVFKRSDPTRTKPWVAQITRHNGKKETIGYFKTEAEAITARNKALRDLESGTLVDKSRQTMGTYLNYWLEDVHKSTVEITTYVAYRIALDKRLIPGLGHIQVQKLTMHQLQMFYSKLIREDGLGPSRVRFLNAILHAALDQAVQEGLIAKNVCDGAKLPREDERDQLVLTPEEARQLLLAAQQSGMRMILLLAIVTGMRRGELLALKWQDVDMQKRQILIRRGLVFVSGRGLLEKNPKSKSSKRDVSLPLFVVEELERHRTRQQEQRGAFGDAWQNLDLVFCSENGSHLRPGALGRRFKKLLTIAHLSPEMRLHDLRHSAVTILLQMGVPPHVVQEIVGHSSVQITLRVYGHVLPGQQANAMEKWDGVLGEEAEAKHARMQQQWNQYSVDVQACLEELLNRYGEGAVQIALKAFTFLQ